MYINLIWLQILHQRRPLRGLTAARISMENSVKDGGDNGNW